MESRISIVTLGVEDLDSATAFYRDGLGLPEQEGEGNIAWFALENITLALYPWDALAEDAEVAPDATGFRGVTLAHNVRTKAAVDALLVEAAGAGGTVVKEAEDAFWGGYSGYFADPDGHLWEVAWNPDWEFDD